MNASSAAGGWCHRRFSSAPTVTLFQQWFILLSWIMKENMVGRCKYSPYFTGVFLCLLLLLRKQIDVEAPRLCLVVHKTILPLETKMSVSWTSSGISLPPCFTCFKTISLLNTPMLPKEGRVHEGRKREKNIFGAPQKRLLDYQWKQFWGESRLMWLICPVDLVLFSLHWWNQHWPVSFRHSAMAFL